MNFLSMKYFLTLSEERSFTKAAEKLHITQQTLSAHISGLEKEVGSRLFVRRVPLDLTDSGEVFLRYARVFSRNETALLRELSDVSGQFKGTIRIGIAPSRGSVILPPLIHRFRKEYPHISFALSEMANDTIWNALKRDEIDIAMARLPGDLPGIAHQPWMKEEIILLISRELAGNLWGEAGEKEFSSPEERKESLPDFLAGCSFLLNSEDDIAGALARKLFRDSGFAPPVAVQSEHMGTMLRLCLMGEGAFFCPKNLAEALLSKEEKEKLYTMRFKEGTYELSFGYQKSTHRWNLLEKWMDAVREDSLPALMD